MLNNALFAIAVVIGAAAVVQASPKVVSMKTARNHHNALVKRQSDISVELGNANLIGLYYVNVSIGTPAQVVALQLDTGSSDLWAFGPNSCNVSTALCVGGEYDSSSSSSAALNSDAPPFQIQYETPNSGVEGVYLQDTVAIGGVTLTSVTLAEATAASYVPTGIMGVGFDTDESYVSNSGGTPYPNIVDVMVNQGLINSHAYSLYLDDLQESSGTILFGGYDTEKYTGDLTALQIYPDAQSGAITSFTVALTSIAVTDSTGTNAVTSSSLPVGVVLDSGTTLTVLPDDIFVTLANAFNVEQYSETLYLINCSYASTTATIDYQFGGTGGPTIQVPVSELVLPLINRTTDQQYTDDSGNPICQFGILTNATGLSILFGDTFLRSAYVVYDLDNQVCYIAQTKFGITSSNIQEIGAANSTAAPVVSAASTTYSHVSVAQTASLVVPPGGGGVSTPATSRIAFSTTTSASVDVGLGGSGTTTSISSTLALTLPTGAATTTRSVGLGGLATTTAASTTAAATGGAAALRGKRMGWGELMGILGAGGIGIVAGLM